MTAVPGGGTCWQSARSGSGCQRAVTSGRRLVWKRRTLVSEAWQSSLKARAWRGCPGLIWAEKSQGQDERRLKSLLLQELVAISLPEQAPPPALPREPCLTAEMLLQSVEPTYQVGSKGTAQGPANSRLGEVSLEYRLDGQVTSLRVLAEVLLGPKLVLQSCGKVSHVLTGRGLQAQILPRCCLMKSGGSQVSICRKEVPWGWA